MSLPSLPLGTPVEHSRKKMSPVKKEWFLPSRSLSGYGRDEQGPAAGAGGDQADPTPSLCVLQCLFSHNFCLF